LGAADLIFVDGPFADGPCRYGTLAQVRSYLAPGARLVLDDALRDKELLTAKLWAQDGVVVEGLITRGQGLMIGRIPNGWLSPKRLSGRADHRIQSQPTLEC
jgi:hypothetical protein